MSHVEGHEFLTPSSLHLDFVALLDTHLQSLAIFFPSFKILKRNGESSHEVTTVGVGGVGVGGVGVGGVGVGGVGVGAEPVVYKSF